MKQWSDETQPNPALFKIGNCVNGEAVLQCSYYIFLYKGSATYKLIRSEVKNEFSLLSLISFMKLTFFGAAGEVTGSCSRLEIGEHKILVDCGLFQGTHEDEKRNYDPLPFDPKELSAVIVTHAHLDHVGRLPLLVKNGYQGFFYATAPTAELTRLVLEDNFGIMDYEHKKFGHPMLYELSDIENVMAQFKEVDYYETRDLQNGIKFKFHEAGHILGSVFVEILAEGKRIVFSGDVGNVNVPILRDTDKLPDDIDLLVCESTYGDRHHESPAERAELVKQLVEKALEHGGVLMIPSFALERTQELLYELNDLIDRHHKIKSLPIFLDSPLAIDTIKVYKKYPQYYDEEAEKFFKEGDDIFNFEGLEKTYTRDESMKINHVPAPKIIIAGSGMMTGGRILHHAIRYVSDHKNTLLLIGYQSPGTLGWKLLTGVDRIPVHGESVPVRCTVKMVNAFSAHGDSNKLQQWIVSGKTAPRRVVLNHGDKFSAEALAKVLVERGIEAEAAEFNSTIEVYESEKVGV